MSVNLPGGFPNIFLTFSPFFGGFPKIFLTFSYNLPVITSWGWLTWIQKTLGELRKRLVPGFTTGSSSSPLLGALLRPQSRASRVTFQWKFMAFYGF
jgi:hypothetical protein